MVPQTQVIIDFQGAFSPQRSACVMNNERTYLTQGGRTSSRATKFMLNQQCYSIHFSVEKEGTPVVEREGIQHLDSYTVLFQHLQSRIKPALPCAVLGSGARTTCASGLP